MDLYIIGRMTRKFEKKSQENVVIVAGEYHISGYLMFLKHLGFKEEFISKKESTRCQIIPDILNGENIR